MNTRRRLVFITGIILFLAGCIASLYLFAMVFNAQVYSMSFRTLVSGTAPAIAADQQPS